MSAANKVLIWDLFSIYTSILFENKNFQVNLETSLCSKNAPVDRAGFKREEDLKLIYGDGAAAIHLAETKIQMSHDLNLDFYQPVYWPSFPLKIKFN